MKNHLLGNRKFIVALTGLGCSTIVALTCNAAVMSAFALVVSAVVTTFMGAHAVADSKWGNGKEKTDA